MRVVLFFLLALNFVFADSFELVKALFTDKNFSQDKLKGELVKHKASEFYIAENFELSFDVLGKNDEHDIIAMHAVSSARDDAFIDLYVYAKSDGIYAMRSLAMTGMMLDVVKNYDKVPEDLKAGIDIENYKLVISSDKNLLEFANANVDKFEKIYELEKSGKEYECELKNLHFNAIEKDEVFSLIVGGMVDNVVGFMRVQSDSELPKMHPSKYIMIKQISPKSKWYLFKTT
ncbi:hypothetical protein [Campylobacter suis]|uniref:Uncharacterized protein n=1 Tax=Campylobacter suis TaxID=2790657 RepID=A0ABM8Q1I3_9BACT|nr:hypothetical protein [Campylobacter suis]CAD7286633.1 hypothetical protein LMG8286_00460 [Campylobacter suis]